MKTITNIIEDKQAFLVAQIESAKNELEELESQKQRTTSKGIEKWLGNEFESSSSLTEEFASFSREYKSEMKKKLGSRFELVSFNRGHFYLSGFIKNLQTNKLAYFSTSDVRYNSGDCWYNNLLIRTAQHDKDYTGGSNDWCNWSNLTDKCARLTQ